MLKLVICNAEGKIAIITMRFDTENPTKKMINSALMPMKVATHQNPTDVIALLAF